MIEMILGVAIVVGVGYAIKTRGVERLDAGMDKLEAARKRKLAERKSPRH